MSKEKKLETAPGLKRRKKKAQGNLLVHRGEARGKKDVTNCAGGDWDWCNTAGSRLEIKRSGAERSPTDAGTQRAISTGPPPRGELNQVKGV